MTTTTITFLYRTRTGLSEHESLFNAIWQVMWASAAPPFVFMSITLINGYIVSGGPPPLTILSSAMNAKVFTLSLMISLLGQSYVRRQLERAHSLQLPSLESSHGTRGVVSEPMFAPIGVTTTEDHPSPPSNPLPIVTADLSQDSFSSDYDKSRPTSSDVSIEKPKQVEESHVVRLDCFPQDERLPR
ncbi:unnamed protein product [Rhizoctonia solani]|uniref:Uncharacterized protein n=1 Tax=Rhizoctonia solani TaxID=456999 RepID=A0A8H2X477_9AGAM|nr:unnamed protein product [Rhizoctonia solani]